MLKLDHFFLYFNNPKRSINLSIQESTIRIILSGRSRSFFARNATQPNQIFSSICTSLVKFKLGTVFLSQPLMEFCMHSVQLCSWEIYYTFFTFECKFPWHENSMLYILSSLLTLTDMLSILLAKQRTVHSNKLINVHIYM